MSDFNEWWRENHINCWSIDGAAETVWNYKEKEVESIKAKLAIYERAAKVFFELDFSEMKGNENIWFCQAVTKEGEEYIDGKGATLHEALYKALEELDNESN